MGLFNGGTLSEPMYPASPVGSAGGALSGTYPNPDFSSTLNGRTLVMIERLEGTFTENSTLTVPAGYMLFGNPVFRNTTGNAVTGGITVGTTDGGVDIMVAIAVGGNGLVFGTDALVLKRLFSKTSNTTIYINAAVTWNSASVKVSWPIIPFL